MTKLNLNKTLFCYKTTKFQPHKNLCFNNIQSLFPYMFTQYVYQVEKYHSYKKSFQWNLYNVHDRIMLIMYWKNIFLFSFSPPMGLKTFGFINLKIKKNVGLIMIINSVPVSLVHGKQAKLFCKYLVPKRHSTSPINFILQLISFLLPWFTSLPNLPSSSDASTL